MKKISVLLAYVLLITSSIIAQRPAVSRKVFKLFDKSLKESAQQYRFMMQRLEADRFPVSWKEKEDRLTTSGSEPWVGGFYPGGLLYLYEYTGDSILYHEALRKMKILE